MIRSMSTNDFLEVSRLLFDMYKNMNQDFDIDDILGNYTDFHQKFLKIVNLSQHYHFVYEKNQEVVGYYLLTEIFFPSKKIFDCEKMCYLSIILVEPSHQKQGIGSQLLSHAKKQAISLGYQELNLEVFSHSVKNFSFYQKHQFIEYTKHMICDLTEDTND